MTMVISAGTLFGFMMFRSAANEPETNVEQDDQFDKLFEAYDRLEKKLFSRS
ncbi:hypothetical protein LC087_03890 [Bacillus carboniphilus]|uniref:Uncharacterized protein n=1 Tax=Bacillus carboniphilus TaxID=86663 RepID=A0ABY9JXT5_9BACI|nr:hypothetical protein [Bacillus carboniphilus]WLR43337.1 hypothetical protein LC087_03890 [Bacillus carboniphilus]